VDIIKVLDDRAKLLDEKEKILNDISKRLKFESKHLLNDLVRSLEAERKKAVNSPVLEAIDSAFDVIASAFTKEGMEQFKSKEEKVDKEEEPTPEKLSDISKQVFGGVFDAIFGRDAEEKEKEAEPVRTDACDFTKKLLEAINFKVVNVADETPKQVPEPSEQPTGDINYPDHKIHVGTLTAEQFSQGIKAAFDQAAKDEGAVKDEGADEFRTFTDGAFKQVFKAMASAYGSEATDKAVSAVSAIFGLDEKECLPGSDEQLIKTAMGSLKSVFPEKTISELMESMVSAHNQVAKDKEPSEARVNKEE
jgi:hypothetical protein